MNAILSELTFFDIALLVMSALTALLAYCVKMPKAEAAEDFTNILNEIRNIIAEDLGSEAVAEVKRASNKPRTKQAANVGVYEEAIQRRKVIAKDAPKSGAILQRGNSSSVRAPSTMNRDKKFAEEKLGTEASMLHWFIVVIFFVGSACPIIANYYITHPGLMARYPITANEALSFVVGVILMLAFFVLFSAIRYCLSGYIPHSNIWTAWPIHTWPTKAVPTMIFRSTRPFYFWNAIVFYLLLCGTLVAFAYYFERLIVVGH